MRNYTHLWECPSAKLCYVTKPVKRTKDWAKAIGGLGNGHEKARNNLVIGDVGECDDRFTSDFASTNMDGCGSHHDAEPPGGPIGF